MRNPRIVTHLFADGGRIIKTTRTEYAEHVSRSDMQPFVRSLMKEQHKGMFTALRMGELDIMLEGVCGPFEQPLRVSKEPPPPVIVTAPPPAPDPAPEPMVTERATPDFETPALASAFGDDERISDRPDRTNSLSNPNLRKVAPSVPPPGASPFDLDVGSLERLPAPAKPPPPPERAGAEPPLPSLHDGASLARRQRPQPVAAPSPPSPGLSRPSARFAATPSKSSSSLFGDGVISEQSLDEVILSYLAEDLDGSSE